MYVLVVYMFMNEFGMWGMSSLNCHFSSNPPTIEDVREMEKLIAEDNEFRQIVIINWLPIAPFDTP